MVPRGLLSQAISCPITNRIISTDANTLARLRQTKVSKVDGKILTISSHELTQAVMFGGNANPRLINADGAG
jgi:hypothetical protein